MMDHFLVKWQVRTAMEHKWQISRCSHSGVINNHEDTGLSAGTSIQFGGQWAQTIRVETNPTLIDHPQCECERRQVNLVNGRTGQQRSFQ